MFCVKEFWTLGGAPEFRREAVLGVLRAAPRCPPPSATQHTAQRLVLS